MQNPRVRRQVRPKWSPRAGSISTMFESDATAPTFASFAPPSLPRILCGQSCAESPPPHHHTIIQRCKCRRAGHGTAAFRRLPNTEENNAKTATVDAKTMTADLLVGSTRPDAATNDTAIAESPMRRRVVLASILGNGLEWFDFVSYGYFASIIATVFFPAGSELALMLTYATFAV